MKHNLTSLPMASIAAAFERGPMEVTDLACHVWLGAGAQNGYGSISICGHNYRAHRAAFLLANGYLTDGLDICHRCDVRRCINPAHLFEGTRKENMQDCASKGRTSMQVFPERSSFLRKGAPRPRGQTHGSAVLSENDVMEIRRLATGGIPTRQMANQFSVSMSQVQKIVQGKMWKHLPTIARTVGEKDNG